MEKDISKAAADMNRSRKNRVGGFKDKDSARKAQKKSVEVRRAKREAEKQTQEEN